MAYKPKEKLLTAEQLCEWWGITPDQLTKLRLKQSLPFIELSKGRYLFKENMLSEWFDEEIVNQMSSRSMIEDD